MAIFPATKGGRCSNGFERDRGSIVHLVEMKNPSDYNMSPALCGTKPGSTSVGWTSLPTMIANCPRCLKKQGKQHE